SRVRRAGEASAQGAERGDRTPVGPEKPAGVRERQQPFRARRPTDLVEIRTLGGAQSLAQSARGEQRPPPLGWDRPGRRGEVQRWALPLLPRRNVLARGRLRRAGL